ncbi:hypothetical protein M0802_009812 [Mischocyttarus mexicanus]|nr:hypothetical protein M0802_009812 [Mischocyttarus mexicanus]
MKEEQEEKEEEEEEEGKAKEKGTNNSIEMTESWYEVKLVKGGGCSFTVIRDESHVFTNVSSSSPVDRRVAFYLFIRSNNDNDNDIDNDNDKDNDNHNDGDDDNVQKSGLDRSPNAYVVKKSYTHKSKEEEEQEQEQEEEQEEKEEEEVVKEKEEKEENEKKKEKEQVCFSRFRQEDLTFACVPPRTMPFVTFFSAFLLKLLARKLTFNGITNSRQSYSEIALKEEKEEDVVEVEVEIEEATSS